MILLKPIIAPSKLEKDIYLEILKYFSETFFRQFYQYVFDEDTKMFNSVYDPLSRAISTGRVFYQDGYFYGDFSSAISKNIQRLGGEYSLIKKGFKIEYKNIPMGIIQLMAERKKYVEQQKNKALYFLDQYQINNKDLPLNLNLNDSIKSIFSNLNDQYKNTLQEHFDIGIIPTLMDEEIKDISTNYIHNLELDIKRFEAEQIFDLRRKINDIVFGVYDKRKTISDLIVEKYGVAKSKANFLASQEVKLITAKYKESRYSELGITKYRWSGAMDSRERPDHKELQGRVFEYANPPIVDKATGRRANAGEDYNCRCVSIPIFDNEIFDLKAA